MKKAEMIKAVQETLVANKANKKLIEAINEIMAEYNRTKSAKEEHPNLVDDKGNVTQVWCIKHLKYEPVEDFAVVTKSKTGYHNKCRVADWQWKDYLTKIKVVENELSEALSNDDFVTAKELNQTKKDLIIAKDSAYDYPDDDEIARIAPKTKE